MSPKKRKLKQQPISQQQQTQPENINLSISDFDLLESVFGVVQDWIELDEQKGSKAFKGCRVYWFDEFKMKLKIQLIPRDSFSTNHPPCFTDLLKNPMIQMYKDGLSVFV